ncbi:hypothetical protein F5Y12DRAFT_61322 [Xylaria sp. FL1777]|nr:hypothetical protein F5Y12DRAFT_61322 [Xylaria sp. FL1777]
MLNHGISLGGEGESVEASTLLAQSHSQKKYKCPQCPSSFKRPENLKRHQRGHDESRRFMCQICDKSFARSDILGRHVSIHVPLERRNDNPQRRRACHECARARERCSRGEPCRRCTIKALCCVYPEEHQFKTVTPNVWSPSTSESDHYNATGSGWIDPQSPLGTPYTGGDMLLEGPESSEWQVEAPPVPYRGPSTLSTSPYKGAHPFRSDYSDTRLVAPFRYDALSPLDEGLCPWGTSNISTNDIASDVQLGGVMGVHDHTIDIPLNLTPNSNQIGFHQPGFSTELQDHHSSSSLDTNHLNTAFYPYNTHGPDSSAHTTMLSQPETLGSWNTLKSHQYLHGAQAPNTDFDDQEALFQSG